MPFETAFSLAGVTAMVGWGLLLASPFIPTWSDRVAGTILPVVLSLGYVVLLLLPSGGSGGGFGSLAAVKDLLSLFEVADSAGH